MRILNSSSECFVCSDERIAARRVANKPWNPDTCRIARNEHNTARVRPFRRVCVCVSSSFFFCLPSNMQNKRTVKRKWGLPAAVGHRVPESCCILSAHSVCSRRRNKARVQEDASFLWQTPGGKCRRCSTVSFHYDMLYMVSILYVTHLRYPTPTLFCGKCEGREASHRRACHLYFVLLS